MSLRDTIKCTDDYHLFFDLGKQGVFLEFITDFAELTASKHNTRIEVKLPKSLAKVISDAVSYDNVIIERKVVELNKNALNAAIENAEELLNNFKSCNKDRPLSKKDRLLLESYESELEIAHKLKDSLDKL